MTARHVRIAWTGVPDTCAACGSEWPCNMTETTKPVTPTGKRLLEKAYSSVPGAIYLAGLGTDDIVAIEREAQAVILADFGWPFDMYSQQHDSPEMRDAVAAEWERREGPCDPDCTWREAIDFELQP